MILHIVQSEHTRVCLCCLVLALFLLLCHCSFQLKGHWNIFNLYDKTKLNSEIWHTIIYIYIYSIFVIVYHQFLYYCQVVITCCCYSIALSLWDGCHGEQSIYLNSPLILIKFGSVNMWHDESSLLVGIKFVHLSAKA